MKDKQRHRLPAVERHAMHGRDIDRSKPLSFRLNGRVIQGFEGDTVLSAVLASGIEAAGSKDGGVLALSQSFHPPIAPVGQKPDVIHQLPMDRTPARNGVDYVTIGTRKGAAWPKRTLDSVRTLLSGQSRNLEHLFDGSDAILAPWIDLPPAETWRADLVVIGGGVAGMGAALAAAKSGSSIIVIERRQSLGGNARLFGSTEGDEPPDAAIARLTTALSALPNVRLMLRSDAMSCGDGQVLVHEVVTADNAIHARVVAIDTPRTILATGTLERRPLFPGNRLPGLTGVQEAFDNADRFGVWSGRRVLVNTAINEAYWLAKLAADAGITVTRIADTRLNPQSRFIEFSKAYGMTLQQGTRITEALPTRRHIAARLGTDFVETDGSAEPVEADHLIIGGPWQRDLTLWLSAGGQCQWDAETEELLPEGEIGGVLLAGSAAGYHATTACAKSGAAAVAQLFARSVPNVDDRRIDEIYETPAGTASIAKPAEESEGVTYLDTGISLTTRPAPVRPSLWRRVLRRRPRHAWPLAAQPRALSIGDVAAAVQLGAVDPLDAGTIAQERSTVASDVVALSRNMPARGKASPDVPLIPPHLADRFGPEPGVWSISSEDGRRFDVGTLLYPNTVPSLPVSATGIVLANLMNGEPGAVILTANTAKAGDVMVAQEIGRQVGVRLVAPYPPPQVVVAEPSDG